ncbi:MAG: phosphotriesterase-related protein [Actinotalea sp.]|nr:phosphotriesterase-related protein [Actinotalea sp.]
MTVRTVLGPVPVDDLGVVLLHEHIFEHLAEALHDGARPFSAALRDARVTPSNAWLLREDPYACADNIVIDESDLDAVCDELSLFRRVGGTTVVDNTAGKGRRPSALVEASRRTDLHIVMAGGWCLAHGDDDTLTDADVDRMVTELVGEIRDGVEVPDGPAVRVGVIGEIGVGPPASSRPAYPPPQPTRSSP